VGWGYGSGLCVGVVGWVVGWALVVAGCGCGWCCQFSWGVAGVELAL
jgi:hypothetical protein